MNIQAQLTRNHPNHATANASVKTACAPVAEHYLAAGILRAVQKRFADAVACFQQALACAADQLGASDWFAGYLMDDASPRSHGRNLLVRIYHNLGQCLFELGRMEDAGFAVDAALRINPDHPSLSRFGQQIESAISSGRGAETDRRHRSGSPSAQIPISESVTLLMSTHFTNKLTVNKHLSPPSIGLVQTTYTSMLKAFGPLLARCQKRLIYDRKDPFGGPEDPYQKNLEKFAGENGFDLVVARGGGLQRNFAAAIEKIRSPYVLWAEHDWEFLSPQIDLPAIINLFERHPEVNVVRFNKRENLIAGFDFLMEKESHISGTDLIRTAACLNNPQILRVDKMRDDWLPICMADGIRRQYDLSCSAFGIEEPLFKQKMQDIRRLGFAGAHDKWGTYIYGRMKDGPKIRHLGC